MSEKACCDDVEVGKLNPFRKSPKSRVRMFDTVRYKDPIDAQISDTDDVKDFFRKFPLIPYAGDNKSSGHSLLGFFKRMTYLSPTHGSCISIQKTLAFGGKIGFTRTEDNDFESVIDNEVSLSDKSKYLSFMKKSIKIKNGASWKELAQSAFVGFKEDGNIFLKVGRLNSMGTKFGYLEVIDSNNIMYLAPTSKGESRKFAISLKFDTMYLTENKPEIVPLYPEFNAAGFSIIHVKNGNGDWYGRPDSMNSFMYQYREFQDSSYLSKQADAGFVGQIVIEVEGDDPETSEIDTDTGDFDSTAERLEANFTNKGDDPSTILFMERPAGASPALIKQFYPNTNEKFFEKAGNIAKLKIIQSHQWSERLLGENVSGAFTNAAYLEEFSIKMPLIRAYQNSVAGAINIALKELAIWIGADETIGIKFISPLKTIGEYIIGDESTVSMDTLTKEAVGKKAGGNADNGDSTDNNDNKDNKENGL